MTAKQKNAASNDARPMSFKNRLKQRSVSILAGRPGLPPDLMCFTETPAQCSGSKVPLLEGHAVFTKYRFLMVFLSHPPGYHGNCMLLLYQ